MKKHKHRLIGQDTFARLLINRFYGRLGDKVIRLRLEYFSIHNKTGLNFIGKPDIVIRYFG